MVRNLVVLVNFLVALFINILFQTPVQMEIGVPSVVSAGETFEVTVTLNKGDLSNFSRYLQQMPYGLTASPSISSNSDFSFKDQKVRLIWLKLPEEETFTFSYKIHVDQRLKGEFNLEGLFSYIENNERKSVSKQSFSINILPSPDISPDQIVDISDFENAVIQKIVPKQGDVLCYRQEPQISETNDGLIINLIVNKGQQERFAKIEEKIPAGYDAMAIDSKEAIFSSKDDLVKFLWMNLPGEEFFSVTYKLIPHNGVVNRDIKIKGTFFYIEDNDKTVSIDILQEEFELTEKTTQEIKKVFDLLTNQYTAAILPDDKSTTDTVSTKDIGEEKSPSLLGQQTTETKTIATTKPKTITKKRTTGRYDVLTSERGVYYRVQIAAGHKPVNIRSYFKKFNLEKNVKKESHEGWYKYSVGSFKLYREARDYRNYIWRTTLIDDAFVSAYNEGKRITVQEALMIANQKWYK